MEFVAGEEEREEREERERWRGKGWRETRTERGGEVWAGFWLGAQPCAKERRCA